MSVSGAQAMSASTLLPAPVKRDSYGNDHGRHDALQEQAEKLATSMSQANTFYQERLKDKFLEKAMKDATSDVTDGHANGTSDPMNPLMLEAEMFAIKDYFRLMKFKYLEQHAKLDLMHNLTGEDGKILEPGENEEKERTNAKKKAALKANKLHLEELRAEALKLSQEVSASHRSVAESVGDVSNYMKKVKEMEHELARIRGVHPVKDRITVSGAEKLLAEQDEYISDLTTTNYELTEEMDKTGDEVNRVAKEVASSSREKERQEALAREARAGREKGDGKVDELCSWFTSAIEVYRALLGIKSIKPVDSNELHLEYEPLPRTGGEDTASRATVTLALLFNESTRALDDAKVRFGLFLA
ncbi:hypothetical protein QFC19_008333 [Naganishia cerealis]|uniref:Uncharacterized protein n=1 Tax=Naganishia cerealis TaxID=610337 RepID=A0ACC2V289_9TREE|nr:hypothetical protein QFC19_008333 [Naganishia cerealis]